MTDSAPRKFFAAILCNLGVSAMTLTFLGLLLAGFSGWLSCQGRFFAAGLALLASGLLDLMDGAVARMSGTAGLFGGILDSSLDRYGDAFALGGILLFCARTGREVYSILALAALVGSFAVSYVRARAECGLASCRVGFWERGERLALLILSLWVGNVAAALWVLAIATHWTAFERLWEARRQTLSLAPPAAARAARRGTALYAAKVLFWGALVCFVRPGF